MWAEHHWPPWYLELTQYKAAAEWLGCSVPELMRDPRAAVLLERVQTVLAAEHELAEYRRKDAEGISDL